MYHIHRKTATFEVEQWLEEVHKSTIRLSSYEKYRKLLNRHILPALGHIQLQKLSPQQVQTFYTKKLEEGLSPSTIRVIHALLHNALENAVRWRLIARNVCDVVSPPRPTSQEIQPLTIEQAQTLLEKARGHRLETLLTLAIVTGMRRGELIGLRWQDINLEEQCLYIRRTVDRITAKGYVESEPKTVRSRGKIMLPSFVIDLLKHHHAQQAELRLKAGSQWQENNLVFCNKYGGFLHPSHLYEMFQQILKDANLPHRRFHDLRHGTATILMAMGIHVKVVQELLGHSNAALTLNVYGHVLPSLQKEAMEKWEQLFGQ